MNRLFLFQISVLLFVAGNLAAQETPPVWYFDKEVQYPASRFISGLGEGGSKAEAENAALTAVSLFFHTRTAIRNEMIREFNEAVSSDSTEFSKKTYISEGAVIQSDADLLGVRFTAPYHNAKTRNWAVLAYIDRAEAAAIYESQITTNMAAINALLADSQREAEPLYSCGLLHRSLGLAGLTGEMIKTAALVDAKTSAKYAPHLAVIQDIRSSYRAKRDSLTFSVKVNASDFSGRVERKLGETLEANGCVITQANPRYTVNAALTQTEETLDSGIFIRSGIKVQVERQGRALFSYNKNYPRMGHRSLDGAYNRAFMAIEQDLEDNFITKFIAMIGR